MKPRISAVINTLNEEKNLPFALRSVRPWVDEIILVDMYSDDRTVDIAREFGAKVFFHERLGFADPARAFALEQASGDWVLVLDADEVVPLPLSRVLMKVACRDSADVVRIPWLNYLLGAPLMHTSWGPQQGTHPRFFKKHCMRTTSAVHNFLHLVPGSRVLELGHEPGRAIVHFNSLDSQQFIEKVNRYTGIEAQQAFERGERITPAGALAKAVKEFGLRYIKGRGFQDGWRGFYLSLFMCFYRIVAAAKLQELAVLGNRERIESRYRQEAEEILRAYGEPFASPFTELGKGEAVVHVQGLKSVWVILLNWNNWKLTNDCLASLQRVKYDDIKVLVLDNGSTDDSVERIRERFPEVEILELGVNLGFAKGNNAGIRVSLERGAEYVWLLNNDTAVDPNALLALVSKVESDPSIGAVGSAVYYMAEPERLQAWGGGYVNFWLGWPRRFIKPVADEKIQFLMGASLLLRRAALESVGLLDEEFFLYWEDAEYCFRMRRAGWQLAVAGDSKVWHKVSATAGDKGVRLDMTLTKSAVRFFEKYSPAPLISIWANVFLRIAKRVLVGDWARVRAVWTGLGS